MHRPSASWHDSVAAVITRIRTRFRETCSPADICGGVATDSPSQIGLEGSDCPTSGTKKSSPICVGATSTRRCVNADGRATSGGRAYSEIHPATPRILRESSGLARARAITMGSERHGDYTKIRAPSRGLYPLGGRSTQHHKAKPCEHSAQQVTTQSRHPKLHGFSLSVCRCHIGGSQRCRSLEWSGHRRSHVFGLWNGVGGLGEQLEPDP